MLLVGVFSYIIGASAPSLTGAPADTDRVATIDIPAAATRTDRADMVVALHPAPADTPHVRRPVAIETSDWYARRLAIHNAVAYATIPVFALQYAAGDQLYDHGRDAPTWAKTMHRVGATALAGMFTVNTVTGIWNWYDSRSAPQGRVLRTIHSIAMLGADAAFTYAGAKLSDQAETSLDKRNEHRTIALSAMGVTIASGLMMKIFNR